MLEHRVVSAIVVVMLLLLLLSVWIDVAGVKRPAHARSEIAPKSSYRLEFVADEKGLFQLAIEGIAVVEDLADGLGGRARERAKEGHSRDEESLVRLRGWEGGE